MRFFIDCEWNDWQGELISMALVSECGRFEFYEVLGCAGPSPWVAANVMPHLAAPPHIAFMPIGREQFVIKLSAFLRRYTSVLIVADWPEDIVHFCEAIVTGPGMRIDTPDLHFHVWRGLDGESKLPHNALEDARGLRDAALRLEGDKAYMRRQKQVLREMWEAVDDSY